MKQLMDISFNVITDVYDGQTGKLVGSFANTPELAAYHHVPFREFPARNYGQGLLLASDQYDKTESAMMPWGYMTPDGKMVIPSVFEKAQPFADGYTMVMCYCGKLGLESIRQGYQRTRISKQAVVQSNYL